MENTVDKMTRFNGNKIVLEFLRPGNLQYTCTLRMMN